MKLTLNLILTIVIFCSATFAGDIGNGGYHGCTINCPPPPCEEECGRPSAGQPPVSAIERAEYEIVWAVVREYFGLGE